MRDILSQIKIISKNIPSGKRVLLRVDFNVTLTEKRSIADDARIRQSLPTIRLILQKSNKLILVSHLDRPEKRDPKYSLRAVAARLQILFSKYKILLVDDFLSDKGEEQIRHQKANEIILLENIRFYKEEKANNLLFAKKLASLADVFVNDAFGVSHRNDASVVSVPKFIPSFAGLLLEKEIKKISSIVSNPKKPFVAIIGGAKISTKIEFLSKLINIADYLLLGGGIANTFLLATGKEIGKSLVEKDQVRKARNLIEHAKKKQTKIILPIDAICQKNNSPETFICKTDVIPSNTSIKDIGPQAQREFGHIIRKAGTIVWNGPIGYYEDSSFSNGTDFLYSAIVYNSTASSLVGGGDTLVAIAKNKDLDKITHISTGGSAMLELIENGTLPGIEALKKHSL